jgi:hypothetical protein
MTNDEAIKILDDTRDYCTKDLNEALKLAIAAIKSNWTVEEKVAEVFKGDFDNDLSDDQNIALHYKKAIEICREHFKTHPKELEGK